MVADLPCIVFWYLLKASPPLVLKFIWHFLLKDLAFQVLQTMACVCSRRGFQNLLNRECFKIVSIVFLVFPGFWTDQYKICVLHCMTYVYCILLPTLSLKSCLEVCSSRFATPRPGIAGTVLMFLHTHIIYIYICVYNYLFEASTYTYTSFHVEGDWGRQILNLRFQCDNSLCLLKRMTIPGLAEQGYI